MWEQTKTEGGMDAGNGGSCAGGREEAPGQCEWRMAACGREGLSFSQENEQGRLRSRLGTMKLLKQGHPEEGVPRKQGETHGPHGAMGT